MLPSATISNSVFKSCPNAPAIIPCDGALLRQVNNSIDDPKVGVVSQPVLDVGPTLPGTHLLQVRAVTVTPNATLRYTTDGTRPNEDSPVLEMPHGLRFEWRSACTPINVKAFKQGMVPSPTVGVVLELDARYPTAPSI